MTTRTFSEISSAVTWTPSEALPIDLDLFDDSTNGPLVNGDDITTLLTDIASTYGTVYVRAPSRTVQVTCDTIAFTVSMFMFLEDESPRNRLRITHLPTYPDSTKWNVCGWTNIPKKPYLWYFTGFNTIKIGGGNLSIDFYGTHWGAGGSRDFLDPTHTNPGDPIASENSGLITAYVATSTSPDLLDFRANVFLAHRYAVYTYNGYVVDNGIPFSGTNWRIKQVNCAGLFWATYGVFFHQGCQHVWFDPDRTVFSDPYLRCTFDWKGGVTGTEVLDGVTRKYADSSQISNWVAGESWFRCASGGSYGVDSLTGGITYEYGYQSFVQRIMGSIGSAAQPFIVRVKDWCVSGPGTEFDPGVSAIAAVQNILFKGDPGLAYGNTEPFKFVHMKKLPSTYGAGCYHEVANLLRVESNDYQNQNTGYDFMVSGDWYTNFWHGDVFLFEFESDWGCRTWGHRLRLPAGTIYKGTIKLVDTDIITGPGEYVNVSVGNMPVAHTYGTSLPASPSELQYYLKTDTQQMYVGHSGAWYTVPTARANVIQGAKISGILTIDARTGTTTVSNVNFTGTATDLINVGASSVLNISNITIASGKRIIGSGTVYLDGSGTPLTLPYTFASAKSDAVISSNGTPNPPSGGSVS